MFDSNKVLDSPLLLCTISYPVIALPPLLRGIFHDSLALVFPGVASAFIGIDGIVQGTRGPQTCDHFDFPAEFTARTLKEYFDPFVSS